MLQYDITLALACDNVSPAYPRYHDVVERIQRWAQFAQPTVESVHFRVVVDVLVHDDRYHLRGDLNFNDTAL